MLSTQNLNSTMWRNAFEEGKTLAWRQCFLKADNTVEWISGFHAVRSSLSIGERLLKTRGFWVSVLLLRHTCNLHDWPTSGFPCVFVLYHQVSSHSQQHSQEVTSIFKLQIECRLGKIMHRVGPGKFGYTRESGYVSFGHICGYLFRQFRNSEE